MRNTLHHLGFISEIKLSKKVKKKKRNYDVLDNLGQQIKHLNIIAGSPCYCNIVAIHY